MRSGLVLALDRAGCLQTARWSDASRSRSRQNSPTILATASKQPPEKVPEIRNDFGQREIRVSTGTIVCCGESPPEGHPHVSLRIGPTGHVVCPYCGTKYRFRRDRAIEIFARARRPE